MTMSTPSLARIFTDNDLGLGLGLGLGAPSEG